MSYLIKQTKTATDAELEAMLRWRRPARSKTEKRFVREYIDSIRGIATDTYGNRFIRIGSAPVLWSSHTDSVHSIGGQQSIIRDGDFVRLRGNEKQSNCLGGDCATGVWLMRQMIKRGIEGLYIFHRDEEIGGLGSKWIATNQPKRLEGIELAIALDRKGYSSIITHQGGRCCSDTFADSLAGFLGGYKADPTGLFTDTANYTDLIGECSNLSVGYNDAHSPKESQNMKFAGLLLEALCDLDTSKLKLERKPGEVEAYSDFGLGYSRWSDWYGDFDNGYVQPAKPKTKRYSAMWENYDLLVEIVANYPRELADWLEQQGVNAADLEADLGINQ